MSSFCQKMVEIPFYQSSIFLELMTLLLASLLQGGWRGFLLRPLSLCQHQYRREAVLRHISRWQCRGNNAYFCWIHFLPAKCDRAALPRPLNPLMTILAHFLFFQTWSDKWRGNCTGLTKGNRNTAVVFLLASSSHSYQMLQLAGNFTALLPLWRHRKYQGADYNLPKPP